MSQAYRGTLDDSSFKGDGIWVFFQQGELVAIEGTEFVRLGTTLVQVNGEWHRTMADAMRAVAARIEEMATRLRLQAEHVRRQADAEDEKAKVAA